VRQREKKQEVSIIAVSCSLFRARGLPETWPGGIIQMQLHQQCPAILC
jgi:hypothetical protein